jgi:hypothetical protein
MIETAADQFGSATSYIVIACTARDRWFDLDAVRTEHKHDYSKADPTKGWGGTREWDRDGTVKEYQRTVAADPAGAPPLDWFQLPADELTELLVKAMLPRRVCRVCGEPSRRIVGEVEYVPSATYRGGAPWKFSDRVAPGVNQFVAEKGEALASLVRKAETLDWTDCGHDDWRDGHALDPFLRNEDDPMGARYIVGDALEAMRAMPDNSVDLILTSPPFFALRSYLPADHPDKGSEIGSEATPGEFLDVILDVVVECRRVLAPHGSLVFEFGDTYSGTGGSTDNREESLGGNDFAPRPLRAGRLTTFKDQRGNPAGMRDITFSGGNTRTGGGSAWPLDKSLTMIPQSFAWALAYGRNPWTGREIEPWRVRNICPWVRPNPPVGFLGDKFRPATSYLTVACVSRDRWFDLNAVRTEHKRDPSGYTGNGYTKGSPEGVPGNESMPGNPVGAPPLDWFNQPTEPYEGSHYATWPRKLCVPFIKSMCPQKVCRVCGEPSRRIVEGGRLVDGIPEEEFAASHVPQKRAGWSQLSDRNVGTSRDRNALHVNHNRVTPRNETLGWTDCGCEPIEGFYPEPPDADKTRGGYPQELRQSKWRPGVVLDPFAGSGTTLAVATGHGRDAIGIDIDGRNAELALERVGPMFLTVERLKESAA